MTAEISSDEIRIRKYQHKDRDEVRNICRQTAFMNVGADAFFEDWELFVDYFSIYYTDYAPESIWVIEYHGHVAGYLFGCADTPQYIKTMAYRILPVVLSKAFWRWIWGKYANKRSHLFLRWLVLKSWLEAPRFPVRQFPAHFHCNLLPAVYHKKLLTRLILFFIDSLENRGISGIHIQTLEFESGGALKCLMKKSRKYHPGGVYYYHERPATLFCDVLGVESKMANRILGSTVTDFKKVIDSVQKHYNI